MIRPQDRLINGQGPLKVDAGAGQIIQVAEHEAEVIVSGGHGGVVWANGGLADL